MLKSSVAKLRRTARYVALNTRRGKASYLDWPLLTEDHRQVVEICRNFADTELSPIAGELDKQHRFPAEQVIKLGELGMLSVAVDTKWGGSGMDTLSYAIAMEEISVS